MLNALEAQENGGEVRLRVRPEDEHVRILVEDDGPGIPEPLRRRVFEMNFTTKEGGTGIGLTVARSLVESGGGRLDLWSGSGEGTTIEILLPASSS